MKIYQLTNITPFQNMCYIIKSKGGKLCLIDGGQRGDYKEIYRLLRKLGKTIEYCFITHPHQDHFRGIFALIKHHPDVKIKKFLFNQIPNDWHEEDGDHGEIVEMNKSIEELNISHDELRLHDRFMLDEVKIEVLRINNLDIKVNLTNNQSCVLRVSDDDFSMIFLADLGIEGGLELIEREDVKADAVQMAHHGQNGVTKEVYDKIDAKYTFWPTAKWLYDNKSFPLSSQPEGIFNTPETRSWLKDKNPKIITSFYKSIEFDTETKKIKTV